MVVEHPAGAGLDVVQPVEPGALVRYLEADLGRQPLHAHPHPLVAVFRQVLPAVDLVPPAVAFQQFGLVLVGDAQVAVFQGVDQQFRQAGHDPGGVRADLGQEVGEFVALRQGLEPEGAFLHQGQGTTGLLHLQLQDPVAGADLGRGGHHRLHQARNQGLGEVEIGAGPQAPGDLVRGIGGGLQDDRNVAEPAVGLELLQHLDPGQLRHHQVQQQDIEGVRMFPEQGQGFDPVLGQHRLDAHLFQQAHQLGEAQGIVIHHEYSGCRHGSPALLR